MRLTKEYMVFFFGYNYKYTTSVDSFEKVSEKAKEKFKEKYNQHEG